MRELYAIEKTTLEAIANAIREKTGSSAPIPVTSLAESISSIEAGIAEPLEYTVKAGRYTDKEDVTGNYYNLPHPSYNACGSIAGELFEDGESKGRFTKICISGYGLGMDDTNELYDAPYPYVTFFNGDTQVFSFEGTAISSYKYDLTVDRDAAVSFTFYTAFIGLFAKDLTA